MGGNAMGRNDMNGTDTRKRPRGIVLLVAASLLGLLLATGCLRTGEDESVRPRERLVLLAAGDLLAEVDVKYAARAFALRGVAHDGYAGLFAPLTRALRTADVGICNLESPVLDWQRPLPDVKPKGPHYPSFFAPPILVTALRDVGFDALNVANNHAHDMGPEGVEQTQVALSRAGLAASGFTRDGQVQPAYLKAAGYRVGFLGATLKMNKNISAGLSRWDVVRIDPDAYLELVSHTRRLAQSADLAVVSLHWGKEYGTAPQAWQVELAHTLCDAGAAVVLGHHSHIAQRVEVYVNRAGRRCVIAYSLGNLLGPDAAHAAAEIGMLLETDWRSGAGGALDLRGYRILPTWLQVSGDEMVVLDLADQKSAATRHALAGRACQEQLRALGRRVGPLEVRL